MLTEQEKFESISSLGIELNRINDLDILLEKILYRARQWVNADAGSIYIRDNSRLNFVYTQNDTLQRNLREGEKLIYTTFSIPIDEETIAGHVALTAEPLNIPDVYQLPYDAVYKFGKKFDDRSGYKTHSVLTIPLKTTKGVILGILQIINKLNENAEIVPFTEEDEKIMFHFAGIAAIALERAQLTRSILMRMISMTELRDPLETRAHVNRVGAYAVEIYEHWARRRNVAPEKVDKNRDILRMAAMLHDVGKIATSDTILQKPGQLDEAEFEIMKQHTIQGARLFLDRQSDFDEAAEIVALNHHERWDGGRKGYPGHIDVRTGRNLLEDDQNSGCARPKAGEEIPLFGRIVALADVYDALTSARCYKQAWDEEKVLSILEKEAGAQFDPELVDILLENIDNIKSIQRRYCAGE